MNRFSSIFVKHVNRNFIILLMVIWTLTSADQCTNYNTGCGTHPQNFVTDKVKLTLITSIPLGYGRPITQTVVPYNNPLVNITAGLSTTIPNTIFSIKVESYEICNGNPTYKTVCCRTATQTCSLSNTETAYELAIIWDPYFKNKISVRAITLCFINNYMSYAVYEGAFDIQANQTSIATSNSNLINLTYIRSYISNPENGSYTDFCNNF